MKTMYNYNPRTYKRDESKEFTIEEIKNLVDTLKENPVNEFWKTLNFGWCTVQRIPANQTGGRWCLISDSHDMTTPQDLFSGDGNGGIYLQISRAQNAYFWEESGHSYLCRK